MKVMDLIGPDTITIGLKAKTKPEAITEMVEMLKNAGLIKNTAEAVDALLQREKLGSTGIGQGVAIPHAKVDSISRLTAGLGISKGGVEFESLDAAPVYLIFLIVTPPGFHEQHLQALAGVSRLFKDRPLRNAVREAKTVTDVINIMQKAEKNGR